MESTKNKGIYIELVSIEENKQLDCIYICNNQNDCYTIKWLYMGTKSAKGIKLSHVYLIVHNLSNEIIKLRDTSFTAIDNDGFSHEAYSFDCKLYSRKKTYEMHACDLHPESKVRFLVLFNSPNISKIIYDTYDELHYSISTNDVYSENEQLKHKRKIYETTKTTDDLINEIFIKDKIIIELRNELSEYIKDKEQISNDIESISGRAVFQRRMEELLCKYEELEDDEYYRIFSLEEHNTVSFNREFDKSKGNYNWINKGDALISLKADNAGYGLDGRTIIKSPVSGIFEFDNNKMISYKEEVCRIKKYPQEQKEMVISELEKREIKENVYKKERKKIIEREALDELIEEGKIFNIYIRKDGNRTTIPMDIATAVWNRDGGKCCICGSNENLEFDHIIPISKGGATTFRNLQILCKNCNIKKSDNI